MAKTLAEKFFIKSGQRIAVLHAPETYLGKTLGDLPENIQIDTALNGSYDSIQLFVTTNATMTSALDKAKDALNNDGVIWICYPKGGDKAKIETDLNRDIIWEALKPFNLKPNRQISIDETWSALRFKIEG